MVGRGGEARRKPFLLALIGFIKDEGSSWATTKKKIFNSANKIGWMSRLDSRRHSSYKGWRTLKLWSIISNYNRNSSLCKHNRLVAQVQQMQEQLQQLQEIVASRWEDVGSIEKQKIILRSSLGSSRSRPSRSRSRSPERSDHMYLSAYLSIYLIYMSIFCIGLQTK